MLGVFTYPLVVDEEFQIPHPQDQWPAELGVVQFIVEWLPFWQLHLHFDAPWLLSSLCAQVFPSL